MEDIQGCIISDFFSPLILDKDGADTPKMHEKKNQFFPSCSKMRHVV